MKNKVASAERVSKKVLAKITPKESEEKAIRRVLDEVLDVTGNLIRPHKLQCTLAGSFLRNTWLSDKKEFDIFILFPESCPREVLERKGLELGKKIVSSLGGRYQIAYAEHPYVRAEIKGYLVDIVPCYKTADPSRIKSAVDRTPHHNNYILKHLNEKLSGQVRLLKQFCKGIGVYGSDLRVEGFSGYLCELLIIKHGSFISLLREASAWEAGKALIDLEKHGKAAGPAQRKRFLGQPLVVIDPVDHKRNVAAALSPANFEKFRQSAADFLKSPSEKFFTKETKTLKSQELRKLLRERGTEFLAVKFQRPEVVDDILWPQLRRTCRRIAGVLEGEGFSVLGSDAWCDGGECVIFFEMQVWNLPAVRRLTGPPVFSATHSWQFRKKYRAAGRVWVEGDRWVAETERRIPDAMTLLLKLLGTDTDGLMERGIASYAARSMARNFHILDGSGILKYAGRNSDFAQFFAYYFKNRIV